MPDTKRVVKWSDVQTQPQSSVSAGSSGTNNWPIPVSSGNDKNPQMVGSQQVIKGTEPRNNADKSNK